MKEIKIKKVLVTSLVVFLIAIALEIPAIYLNLPFPKNNPEIWKSASLWFIVISVSIFGIGILTGLLKKLYKKHPHIHVVTFWAMSLLLAVITCSGVYEVVLTSNIFTGNNINPHPSACRLCTFTRGDYILYYDKNKQGRYGELLGLPGDAIKADKGVIYLNGKEVSLSLLSWTTSDFSETITLGTNEYLVLQYDIIRTLSKETFLQGKTSKEYIAGKIKGYTIATVDNGLTEKDKQIYIDTYQDPQVIFLRKALDAYVNDQPGQLIASQAIKKAHDDSYTLGLDSFEKDYFKSKFIITNVSDEVDGGKVIQIISIEKPDRLFNARINKISEGKYELSGFGSLDTIGKEVLSRSHEYFKPLFVDQSKLL